MPLINDRVQENAKKCLNCIVQISTQKMKQGIQNKNILVVEVANFFSDKLLDNAVDVKRQMDRMTCNFCPNQDDFKKVFGMSPWEYFLKQEEKPV